MSIDGKWAITTNTPNGSREALVTLSTDGNVLQGILVGPEGNEASFEGTVDGNNVSWMVNINSAMGPIDLSYTGSLGDDGLSGTVQLGPFGASDWSAVRAE
jgi:hypothetical protein